MGWGVLHYDGCRFRPLGYGSIQTRAGQKTEERLKQIHERLTAIIEKYHPDVMSIEELFWNTNQKTGIAVAEARGVLLLTAHEHGIPIFEYTPLQVKQSIVSYGRAEKAGDHDGHHVSESERTAQTGRYGGRFGAGHPSRALRGIQTVEILSIKDIATMWTSDQWKDYELLDASGRRAPGALGKVYSHSSDPQI